MIKKILLPTPEETMKFGIDIAKTLKIGDIITLSGCLGAGKTCLAGAIINYFYPEEIVTSPTFNIVNIYNNDRITIYHYDLYRLKNKDEIFNLGIEESFFSGISIIEWPEIAQNLIQKNSLISIKIDVNDNCMREAEVVDMRVV